MHPQTKNMKQTKHIMPKTFDELVAQYGYYVCLPINFVIVFTPSELVVLSVVKHCLNIGTKAISLSLLKVWTGLSQNTIKDALTSLLGLDVLSKGKVCKKGTIYTINEKKLARLYMELNKTTSPVERLRIADRFRGEGEALHTGRIAEFENTEFDTRR